MTIRAISRLQQSARRLKELFEHRAIILLYHRVTELRSDPWSLAVTPDHFSQHLKILQHNYHPIGLKQLASALDTGGVPNRSVVVTFDDGYADNLYNAKPILAHHAIPATIFLTTEAIGNEHEYWWDELDKLLLQPGIVPGELRLSIDGSTYSWKLGPAAYYTENTAERYRSWKASEKAPTARHVLYRALWELLYPLTTVERQKVLNELQQWAGVDAGGRPSHRTLSSEEVTALAQGNLLDIGAHTMTHAALASLPAASQRYEIQQSKTQLEQMLGHPVAHFSYPYGKPHHYTSETVSMVQEAGFACACSNISGAVGQSADPYELPRMYVHNWDGEQFARRLQKWLPAKVYQRW